MATHMSQTLIVMPALNEEEVIGSVISEARAAVPDIDILVVDDGSRDTTALTAANAGASVLRLPFNLGVGGAMRAGFKYAIQEGYQNVIQVDSDGQHNPADIPALLQKLDFADLVIGARFAGVGDYSASGPRKWAMSLLSRSISRISKVKLNDTTSGFRATGPRAVQLFAEHYPAEYLGDTVESLVIAVRAGCQVDQMPVAMRPRAGGVPSHNPLKSAIYLGRAGIALTMALMRPPVKMTAKKAA